MKILAKKCQDEDPEILEELYRIYWSKHLEKVPYVNVERLDEILKTDGKEALGAKS